MSSLEWSIIQLLFLVFGFIAFVLFMVLAPVVLVTAKVNEDRKKRQQEASGTSAPPPTAPTVVVSQEDGRVIAMEAPELPPAAPAVVTQPKDGINLVKDVLLPVAGKVAVAVVASHFKHRHHK